MTTAKILVLKFCFTGENDRGYYGNSKVSIKSNYQIKISFIYEYKKYFEI